MSSGLQLDFLWIRRLAFTRLSVQLQYSLLLTVHHRVMVRPAIKNCRPVLGYRPVAVAVDSLVLSPQHSVLFARSVDREEVGVVVHSLSVII